MKILKKISRAEWCMFAITVALLICIHTYCTVKANTYKELDITTGRQETIEVIVEGTETVSDDLLTDDLEEDEEVVEPIVEEPSEGLRTSEKYIAEGDVELGEFIFHTATEYGVKPEIVLAIIEKESGWNTNAAGDSGRSLGLMQIQPKWHQWRMDEIFGADNGDWFNPYHNVAVGCHLLRDLYDTGLSEEWVLMAYNGGYGYAHDMVAAGEVSEYARFVLALAAEIKGV
jgi:hypothetical protein